MLLKLLSSCFPLSTLKLAKPVRYLKLVQAKNVEGINKKAGIFFTKGFE